MNGNGKSSNNHLSLFLQVADCDNLPFGWKKNVSYVLTLEHPKDEEKSFAKRNPDKTFKVRGTAGAKRQQKNYTAFLLN